MSNVLTADETAAFQRAQEIARLKELYYNQKKQADTYNGHINNYKSFKGYLINFQGVLVNDLANKISNAKSYYENGGYILENGKTLDDGLLQSFLDGINNMNSKITTILEFVDNKIKELQGFYDRYNASANTTKNYLWNSYGVVV